MLEQASAWLDGMRVKHMSRRVTYTRGTASVELSATLGSTTYEVTDDYGATVEAKATDFLVSADELVLGAERTLPEPGDQVRVTEGQEVLVFEVMELGGTGHYRPCDPYRKTLHVTVVPKGMTVEPASRSLIQDDYQIDVAVQKKLNAADNAELDELMGLVEEIGDFFRRRRLDAVPDAVCVKIENVPIYAPEHISELRGFTSILTLTFRVLR